MSGVAGQSWHEADAQLPELAQLFDNSAIASLLGRQKVDVCADYIRYKPGTSALVRLVEQDSSRVLGYAKTFARSDAAKLQASALKCSTTGATAPLRFGQCSLVFPLPSDHRLQVFWRSATDSGRHRLGRRLKLAPDSLRPLDVLAYKPEKRCVLRARGIDDTTVIVKLLRPRHWELAYANANTTRPVARVPALLRASRSYGALIYDCVAGQGMRERLNEGFDSDALQECGAALGRLQSGSANQVPRLSRQSELAALDATAQLLAALLRLESPQDAQRAVAIHAHLRRWLERQPEQSVLCHGDFYDKQLLLTAQGLTLLDFDDACAGDPRLDVANFVAHRLRQGDKQGEQILAALLDGFPNERRALLRNISGYVAVRLFLLSHHPFRALQDNWLEATRHLLDLCWHWYEENPNDI